MKRIRKSAPPSILFLQLIGVANLLTPVYSSYFIAQPLHMRRMRPLKKQTVLLKTKTEKPNEQTKSARKSLLEVAGLNIVFGPPMITTWECISLKSNFVTRLPVLHFGR